jgi:hypothetical protein
MDFAQVKSATDPGVKRVIEGMLETQPDIAVERRVAYGAGRRDWYLLSAAHDYDVLVSESRPSDLLVIALSPALPLRDRVGDEFADKLRSLFSRLGDWSDELVAGIVREGHPQLDAAEAFSLAEKDAVNEWLRVTRGELAAAGPWDSEPANGQALLAVIPQLNGELRLAPY